MIAITADMTIEQALQQAVAALRDCTDSAKLDAEVLLAHCLERDRSYLYTWPERHLNASQAEAFGLLLRARASGRPVAHLLGQREFWSLPIHVNESTLIPRPDTEILIEQALELNLPAQAQVLDLGTGTGAIALALKHSQPQWQVTAVDRITAAVELARHNAEHLQLDIQVLQSDWFAQLPVTQQYDLVVSNPPYIDADDPHLNQGDVRFEPHSALVAEHRGFADIEKIITAARDYLADHGWLFIEHGYQQAAEVRQLFCERGYTNVSTVNDYANLERVTRGQWRHQHGE